MAETRKRSRGDLIIGFAVFLFAFGLYFATAARDIVVGDTTELITVAVTLGVAHPPGYPLFTMLGHWFSLLPIGPVPFRVNLLAVVCDALAVAVVYFTALRLTAERIAAAIAAIVLAVNLTFWAWSLEAEVFPLNNLLAALLIYFLVRWHERPERTGPLVAASLIAGLAVTNHQTFVLLGPAVCFLLWQNRAVLWKQPQTVIFCAAAFLLGLLPYLYVPWASARHPVYNWGEVSSAHDLLALILRKSYGTHHLVSIAGYTGGSPAARILALCFSLGPLAGALTLFGVIGAWRQKRWYFWFASLAFIFAGPFFVCLTNLNLSTAPSALFVLQRFFLLSQVVIAPLLAFGVLLLAQFIARATPGRSNSPLYVVAIIVLIAALASVVTNYRAIDLSHNSVARRFGEDVFATAQPGSILFANGDGIVLPLIYLQTVENLHRDVTVVALPLLRGDWYVRQLRAHHPEFNIPFNYYDARTENLKLLIQANETRTAYIAGTIDSEDQSLDHDYWPHQYGVLTIIEAKSKKITVEQMAAENEPLLNRYHAPAPASIRAGSFENDILMAYAWPAFRIGSEYDRAGLKTRARAWYERALRLNPRFTQAHDALARMERQ